MILLKYFWNQVTLSLTPLRNGQLDNKAATAYLNRCDDTSSRALGDIVLAVTSWREERWVTLVPYYVPDLWPVDIDVFRSKLGRTVAILFAAWTLQPGATIVRPFSVTTTATLQPYLGI